MPHPPLWRGACLPRSLTANCCCLSRTDPPWTSDFTNVPQMLLAVQGVANQTIQTWQPLVLLSRTPRELWGPPSSVGTELCNLCYQIPHLLPWSAGQAPEGQLSPGCPLKAQGASWLPRRRRWRSGHRATAPGMPTQHHTWRCPLWALPSHPGHPDPGTRPLWTPPHGTCLQFSFHRSPASRNPCPMFNSVHFIHSKVPS